MSLREARECGWSRSFLLSMNGQPSPCPLPWREGERSDSEMATSIFSLECKPQSEAVRVFEAARTCCGGHFEDVASEKPGADKRFSLSLRERVGVRGKKACENQMLTDHSLAICAACFLGFLLFFTGSARATSPHLQSILPTGGQIGKELEVSFDGDRLQDTEEIISYEPGMKVLKLNLVTNKTV